MEFILEGNPVANNSAFLAVGTNIESNLRYEVWDNTGELASLSMVWRTTSSVRAWPRRRRRPMSPMLERHDLHHEALFERLLGGLNHGC